MSLLRKSMLVSGGQVLGVVLGTLTVMILSRRLGPIGMGHFDLLRNHTSTVALTIAALGIGNANVYFLNNRKIPGVDIASNTAKFTLGMGLLLALLITALVVGLPEFFPRLPLAVTLVFGLSVGMQLAVVLLAQILTAQLAARKMVLVDMASRVLLLAGTAVLAVFHWLTINTALLLVAASVGASLAVVLFFLRDLIHVRHPFSWRLFRDVLGYGVKLAPCNILTILAFSIGVLLFRHMRESAETDLGLLTRAIGVCQLVLLLPRTVGPLLYAKWSSVSGPTRARQVEMAARMSVTYGVASAAVLLLFGKYLIWILYGAQYLPAATVLRWLAPALVLWALYDPCNNLLASDGRAGITAWVLAGAVGVITAVTWLSVPVWGMQGAALGTLAGNLFMALASHWVCRRLYGLNPWRCLVLGTADVTYLRQAVRG